MKFSQGDILVPKHKQYPEGAIVVDGYDDKGRLLYHVQGGGFQARMDDFDASLFRLVEEGEKAAALYQRGTFEMEGIAEKFNGWSNGETWNGWAMPFFEFAEAEKVVRSLRGDGGRFEAEQDAFVTPSQDDEEVWASEFITVTDGSRIKVYPVGAGSWIWDCEPQLPPTTEGKS